MAPECEQQLFIKPKFTRKPNFLLKLIRGKNQISVLTISKKPPKGTCFPPWSCPADTFSCGFREQCERNATRLQEAGAQCSTHLQDVIAHGFCRTCDPNCCGAILLDSCHEFMSEAFLAIICSSTPKHSMPSTWRA